MSNLPGAGTGAMAHTITTDINIQAIIEGLDAYAKVCYNSKQILKIVDSVNFVSNFNANAKSSIIDSFATIIPQLDETHAVYFRDMVASIQTYVTVADFKELTTQLSKNIAKCAIGLISLNQRVDHQQEARIARL